MPRRPANSAQGPIHVTDDNTSAAHRINTPDVVAEDFQGQMVILNLANGHYFTLEGSGGGIWSLLEAGCAPAAILADIASTAPDMAAASEAFVRQLMDHGLVVADPDRSAAKLPAGTNWSGPAPRLEVYTELAELIASDPIHDVEAEAGWPILAKAD